ncbi:MAG: DUF2231 domain-containing protein [Bacteroidales bacterium]|nr:DUF2231 domain-containing protein [Bacteroidales bacterium]
MFTSDHIHPMVAHFPVALIIVGFLFEIFSLFFKKEACLSKTGFYLLEIGALSVVVTYLSGVIFTEELTGPAHEVMETHELFALLTMITMVVNALFRLWLIYKKKEETNLKWFAFSLYAISTVLVGITGFFGGTLAYNYLMTV